MKYRHAAEDTTDGKEREVSAPDWPTTEAGMALLDHMTHPSQQGARSDIGRRIREVEREATLSDESKVRAARAESDALRAALETITASLQREYDGVQGGDRPPYNGILYALHVIHKYTTALAPSPAEPKS